MITQDTKASQSIPNPELLGLKVMYDFVTDWEEADILSHIDRTPMSVKRGGRSSIKRWGSGKCYDNFIVSEEIPEWLSVIAKRIIDFRLLKEMPTEISVNIYGIGDYIAPHIDNENSGEKITVLSLLGKSDMELTKDGERLIIPLPPRTLVQLTDEFRWLWKHSIPPVTSERVSIVFRCGKNK